MLKSKSRWKLHELNEMAVTRLQNELGLSSLTASLLVGRGISTPEEGEAFLQCEKQGYFDPFLMDGMEKAVQRIRDAIENKERILVYGDYDADGVSSTSVMVLTLHSLGADFDYYIPNRFTEGYGPNEAAFRNAKEEGYSVIITVDTGISAVHEADVAKELGIDLVITDHHEPPPVLPDAYAIVNPKKPGCNYPFKGLAGVGVAFKFAQAILEYVPTDFLDLVVIGTVADLVPLVSENRLIVKEGLKKLQQSERIGINALLDVCGLRNQPLDSEHVGFAIGPRVNALGRLGSAMPAVELFTTQDKDMAYQLAEELDLANKERQAIVNEITVEAMEEVESHFPPNNNSVLIIAKEGWNPGVIGIVASRLVEKYYRPTIVLSIDPEKGTAKGSARSIDGFDMFENLSKCRDILPHFGGHPMAAGMTLKAEDLNQLRERLNKQASEQLTEDDFNPITKIDMVCELSDISLQSIEEMNKLAPFGVANPAPRILIQQVGYNEVRKIGTDGNHLKVKLQKEEHTLDVIGFQFGSVYEHIATDAKLSVVGGLSINEWNGFRKPQLMLEDIAVEEWQLFDYRGVKELSKKLNQLPKEKLSLFAFRASTLNHLNLMDWKEQVQLIQDSEEINMVETSDKYLFLLDLPYHVEQLENLLTKVSQPERIYTVLHSEEDHYFNPIPTRDQFKWFYGFLFKRKVFDLNRNGKDLGKHKGWTLDTIQFMSQVFFDLEFVTIENGIITISDSQQKRDLSESKTYKKKYEQMKLEKELCYSSYNQLKDWFVERMNSTDLALGGAVNNGL